MAALLLLICLMALCPGFSARAWAAEAACEQVEISAQVETDASLHVVEQRILAFDGLPQVLRWDFAKALEDAPDQAELSVVGVRVAALDAQGVSGQGWLSLPEAAFVLAWREAAPSGKVAYSFDSPKDAVHVFLDGDVLGGLGLAGETLVVELEYVVEDGVSAYEDVAELNWTFVSGSWGLDSRNVEVGVALPVPAGASAQPGANVFAWGHGPEAGSLSLKADGSVVYADDEVRAGCYLEARVLFPVGWLSNAEASVLNAHQGELLLESAQAEEEMWNDADSGWLQGRLRTLELAALACAGALAAGLALYLAFCRERRSGFAGAPCGIGGGASSVSSSASSCGPLSAESCEGASPAPSSDPLPEEMPPAVLGRLLRWNRESWDDFAASVLSLERAGVLRIGCGSYTGPEGEVVEDFHLTVRADAARACENPLERATLNLLFSHVASGAPSLWTGTVRAWANENPRCWLLFSAEWQRVLSCEVEKLDLFDRRSKRVQKILGVLSALVLACGLAAVAFAAPPVLLVFTLPTSFALLVLANYAPRRTERGSVLAARCEAAGGLRRLFADGSRSREHAGVADVISATLAEATESARAARL